MLDNYGVPQLPDGEHVPVSALNVSPGGIAPLLDVAFAHPIRLIASALGTAAAVPGRASPRGGRAGSGAGRLAGARGAPRRCRGRHHRRPGHRGRAATRATIATMVLVPEVVDAVAPIPVLAAGGIARGRQIAAALALGAEGVWCGSVWLTTEEAETDPVVKQKFLAATSARHGAVALAHRASRPACCARRGPTSGTALTRPRRCRCRCRARSWPRPRSASTARPSGPARAPSRSTRTSSVRSSAR